MKVGAYLALVAALSVGLLVGCEGGGGDDDDDDRAVIARPQLRTPWASFVGHWHRVGDEDYPDRDIDVYVADTGKVTLYVDGAYRGKRAWRLNTWIDFEDDKSVRFEGTDTVLYLFDHPTWPLNKVH